MNTHDRHAEDIPVLTEVGPKTAATDQQWKRPDGSKSAADPATARTEPAIPGGEAPPVEPDAYPSAGPAEPAIADTESPVEMSDPSGLEAEPSSQTALFGDDELAGLRARWDNVQAGFVDDPKDCVHKADGLVSDVTTVLTTGFTQARSRLEQQWGRGEEASTEDLRIALKRYRDFFERLLAV